MGLVGTPVARAEDRLLVAGRGSYVDNLRPPEIADAVHLTFVRSPVAHARIRSMNLDEARRAPGVVAVLTAADVTIPPAAPVVGPEAMAQPVLAADVVRYVGEPVAVVAAESAAAEDAAASVHVEYDDLPPVVSVEEAVRDRVLLFPECGTNVAFSTGTTDDDRAAGLFDDCDVVVTQQLDNQRVAAVPMEPRAALCVPGGDGRRRPERGRHRQPIRRLALTWQGFSARNPGNVTQQPGTSILQGIRQVAPGAQVTYSADASAPTAGSDVGVVVVGETPYSEGFGDVGGPQWAYDPADAGVPREPKSLELNAADRAAVDKVCGELPKCVVLVVSGRPQIVTDQLGSIDALVASWLPGTEGAGVADVLFGRKAFTGTLPVSWPRTAAQEPVNVGDANYDPLFRFGYGLRTFVH